MKVARRVGRLTEAWGGKVPESEDYEGGFEAVTMTGVPHNVSITDSNRDLAETALHHLLDGLHAFGFTGRVAAQNATGLGQTRRYEIGSIG